MKKIFLQIILIFSITNIYARGLVEKSYEYNTPMQFKIDMSKEKMISKLKKIVNINIADNYIVIPIRMFKINNNGKYISAPNTEDQAGDSEHYMDATFYFYTQYENNHIYLYKCNAFFAEDLNFIPDEIGPVFEQIIVNYLLENKIPFNFTDKKEIIFSDNLTVIKMSQSVPSFNDFRTTQKDLYWEWNNELIKTILSFNWIERELLFPGDYIYFRFPEYSMQLYNGNNYTNDAVIFSIWKDKNTYFVQMENLLNREIVYYSVRKEEFNKILGIMNIKL